MVLVTLAYSLINLTLDCYTRDYPEYPTCLLIGLLMRFFLVGLLFVDFRPLALAVN